MKFEYYSCKDERIHYRPIKDGTIKKLIVLLKDKGYKFFKTDGCSHTITIADRNYKIIGEFRNYNDWKHLYKF